MSSFNNPVLNSRSGWYTIPCEDQREPRHSLPCVEVEGTQEPGLLVKAGGNRAPFLVNAQRKQKWP